MSVTLGPVSGSSRRSRDAAHHDQTVQRRAPIAQAGRRARRPQEAGQSLRSADAPHAPRPDEVHIVANYGATRGGVALAPASKAWRPPGSRAHHLTWAERPEAL